MWRNKSIPHYGKLLGLYGQYRATGEYAETAFEIKQRRATTNVPKLESIYDIDEILFNHEATLYNCDVNNNKEVEISPEAQSEATPQGANPTICEEGISSKKRKGKAKDVETGLEMLANSINTLVEAFVKSSAETVKKQPTYVMSENEVWTMLEKMQVDESIFYKVYFYLIRDNDAQRALLGCPQQHKMKLLTYLLSINSIAP